MSMRKTLFSIATALLCFTGCTSVPKTCEQDVYKRQVQASGGGINSTPSISIRGGGAPIYVIDGVIRSAADFQNLSPDDIEAMSILKDASATAVYGSRATNGIIQVTTKRGKEGKPTVEYDFNMSFSQPSIWPEKMGSYDRAVYANIARANDGAEPMYSEEALEAFRTGSDPLNFANTDWRKLVLNDLSLIHI